MGTYLKKNEKRKEEYFFKWKDIELGQYIGSGSLAQTISNFLEHKYEDKFIFVLLKRNSPLCRFTLYNGNGLEFFFLWRNFSWKRYFLQTREAKNNGIIPINSQVNIPFWMDWIKFRSENLEELFCYTHEDSTCLKE